MAHAACGGFFDHTGPDGDTVSRRIVLSGYLQSGRTITLAENIAWISSARSTAAAIVADWLASAEHRANLVDASFRDTGIGLALMAQGGRSGVGITEDFGALG